MMLFALSLRKGRIVFVEGAVSLLDKPLRYTTGQEVEIQVRKLYCVNRADPKLPIRVEDAGRSAEEFAIAEAKGVQLVRVGQDTRLDYRVIHLRTPAKQAIFRIHHQVENEAATDIEPMSDLNTEVEKKLSQFVREKYATDFFSFYIDILCPHAPSTPCLVMKTQRTTTLLMSSFEARI